MMTFPVVHAQDGPVSEVWVADQGDGTYINPLFMPIIPIRMFAGPGMIII
jgi:hypothetical protein